MQNEKTIFITGYSGFVGQRLISKLNDYAIIACGRKQLQEKEVCFFQANIDGKMDYTNTIHGAMVVIHIAARVHVMSEDADDSLLEYRKVNLDGTLNLARQAAKSGVKRFIFISSIKVNGEVTQEGQAFLWNDEIAASDPYGISKAEAELGLRKISAETGMEVVIIRPPLVYGPGVKANFAAMMNLAKKNLPLPLGAIHNKRSLVALDNLIDLIITCIDHPKAANQTFLVSDDQDVSTTELLSMMKRAANKKLMLLPVPVSLLRLAGKLLGKQAVIDRLCDNLQLDITHTKDTLGWKPPVPVEEGIRRCFVREASV